MAFSKHGGHIKKLKIAFLFGKIFENQEQMEKKAVWKKKPLSYVTGRGRGCSELTVLTTTVLENDTGCF